MTYPIAQGAFNYSQQYSQAAGATPSSLTIAGPGTGILGLLPVAGAGLNWYISGVILQLVDPGAANGRLDFMIVGTTSLQVFFAFTPFVAGKFTNFNPVSSLANFPMAVPVASDAVQLRIQNTGGVAATVIFNSQIWATNI